MRTVEECGSRPTWKPNSLQRSPLTLSCSPGSRGEQVEELGASRLGAGGRHCPRGARELNRVLDWLRDWPDFPMLATAVGGA